MNPMIKNSLAAIAGIVVGTVVNMGLIMVGSAIIPAPPGVDVMDSTSIANSLHLFEPQHFVFPFLAHALGTLVGAFVAAKLAVSHKMRFAFGIGIFFLIGGVASLTMIPAPTWFAALDLIVAYLPMGWLGGKMADR